MPGVYLQKHIFWLNRWLVQARVLCRGTEIDVVSQCVLTVVNNQFFLIAATIHSSWVEWRNSSVAYDHCHSIILNKRQHEASALLPHFDCCSWITHLMVCFAAFTTTTYLLQMIRPRTIHTSPETLIIRWDAMCGNQARASQRFAQQSSQNVSRPGKRQEAYRRQNSMVVCIMLDIFMYI